MNREPVLVKDLTLIPVERVFLSDALGLCITMVVNMQEAKLYENFDYPFGQR